MTILIYNWRDPKHPLAGGAEIMLLEHAKYWVKKKNKVIWFAASFNGAKAEEIIDGIKIIRRGSHFTVKFWAFLAYVTHTFGKIDVVVDCFHFHPFFTPLYVRKPKIIALIHEVAGRVWFSNIWLPIALVGYITEPFTFLFYKNTPFITVSNSTKKELKKLGITKITVVENGINTFKIRRNTKKEKDPTVVFLGRISKDKGMEDALFAISKIREKIQNIQLLIIGKPESKKYFRHIKSVIKDRKVKKHIKFFGFVSEEEKFSLLSKAWILIHPSKKEGWGLTVIEAASQKTPTLGYNVEGLKDSVINGKTGVLVKPNPLDLAKKLEELLKNRSLVYKLAENSYIHSKKYSWKRATEKTLQYLKSI